MDKQTQHQDTPDFTDILEFNLAPAIPTNPNDTPEIRARKLAAAQRQFFAFRPTNEAEALVAAMAVSMMWGASDSTKHVVTAGADADARLRGNALAAARYTTTLEKMQKRNQQEAKAAAPAFTCAPNDPAPDPPSSGELNAYGFPKIETFQPRDRRGNRIPRWRFDLLSMKQRRAAYDFANKAAWAIATEEEDAAIAEQAELDALNPPTEEDLKYYLPITPSIVPESKDADAANA